MYVRLCVRMCVRVWTSVCLYVHLSACMYVYRYVFLTVGREIVFVDIWHGSIRIIVRSSAFRLVAKTESACPMVGRVLQTTVTCLLHDGITWPGSRSSVRLDAYRTVVIDVALISSAVQTNKQTNKQVAQ